MKNEVSIKKIRRDAGESFRKGDYFSRTNYSKRTGTCKY